MIKLNVHEQAQYNQLLAAIRSDIPFNKQPARTYNPLIRGRVCVALNQSIDSGAVVDIRVDRSEMIDRYFHI